jgi:AraC-like DNA-binding protein
MKALPRLVPDYEVIICPPEESFRWFTHDYPYHLAKWNYHPEYELHMICSTSGTMMVGDHLGDFGPGNLILTGPNLPHNWVSNIPPGEVVHNRDMLIQFTPEFAERVAGFCPELGSIRELYEDAAYGVEFSGPTATAGQALLAEIEAAHGAERVILFLRLMDVLARDPADRRRLSRLAPARRAELPPSIDQAMRLLNESHAEDLHLEAVAEVAGMTAQGFSRLFKRQTGHTFASYLVLTRVYAACTLLTQTHRPVTEICFEVGFNNVANFNRQFLKLCGRTPSEYRRIAHRIGAESGSALPNTAVEPLNKGGKV